MQSRNLILTIALSLSVFLGGCATSVVDLSDSIYSGDTVARTANSKMATLTIENTAKPGKLLKFPSSPKEALLGRQHIPIRFKPISSATIEKDIRRFFEERLAYDTNSAVEVLIKIEEANSYWNMPAKDRWLGRISPLTTLWTAKHDKDIGMNLKFSISLIKDGEEFAHYLYDTPIIIQSKTGTKQKLVKSYKELVSTYRNEVFSKLDTAVIEKYFSN